ncbi:hypothetical protein D3C77_297310 [compost metagenome]
MAVGDGHCAQLFHDTADLRQGKEVIDGRAQFGQGRVVQHLGAQFGQYALQVLERVCTECQAIETLVEQGQFAAVQVPVGQAAVQRISGLNLYASHAQIGAQLARHAREEIAAADIREVTDAHFRHGQAAALGDHPQLRTLGQAHAATQGKAVHQRQNRLAVMVDAQVEGVFLDEEIAVQAVTGFVAVVKRTDVAAGTEAFRAFAAQHHGMYLIINRPGVELLLKAANHVQGQGVEASRAVEGQVTDMVANLGQNRRLGWRLNVRGHRCLPALLLIFHVKYHDLGRR